jgi:hypothetical protein
MFDTIRFSWIGVHLVFGPLVQKLLNINFNIENSMKFLKKIVGEVGACF